MVARKEKESEESVKDINRLKHPGEVAWLYKYYCLFRELSFLWFRGFSVLKVSPVSK